MQKALRAVGFDPAPVDGLVGPRAQSAVRTYQEVRGLPQDGVITKILLASLAKEVTESR
ncbi:MAG TPA: peptidoglycan-binding domain-containing protein [Longimicrobium sp.]|nr:peptidoglycan-binding domain-containing protein [Longimicrobium sp.]